MQNFINYCYERAKTILTENKDKLEIVAQTLPEVETLDAKQIKSLFEDGELYEPQLDEQGAVREEKYVKVNIQSKDEEDVTTETYEEAKEKAEEKYEEAHEKAEKEEQERTSEEQKENDESTNESEEDDTQK